MIASRRLVLASAFVVASLAALTGCSGTHRGVDLVQPQPDPNDPEPTPEPTPDPPCATIAPACNGADTQYASEGACKASRSEYCYSRSSTCNGSPVSTIWCGEPTAQCTAVPTCNGGDREVTACPGLTGVTCYTRSMCGTTITCMHQDCKALPTCDPGDTQVSGVDSCSKPGVTCYSRTACSFTIWCARAS